MKRAFSKAWSLFKAFWSFSTEAKVNRRDFWITFVMMIVFSIGLYMGGYHFMYWLNQKIEFIGTDLGFFFLFALIFAFYALFFWVFLIVFVIRRLKDAGLKKYWIYLTVLIELAPFFIVIFSDTSSSEVPLWLIIVLLYLFPFNPFQLPMFLPLLFCLLSSKSKDFPKGQ